MTEHYKSWSGIKKRAESFLCDSLKERITYFLTYYHEVHNTYGRAAIRLDGKECVCFSWIEVYNQERDISEFCKKNPSKRFDGTKEWYKYIKEKQKPIWDADCTYSESDFINAVQRFFHLGISKALSDDDFIIKILAILDRRTGRRVLEKIKDAGEYLNYPGWVKFFYELRFETQAV